LNNDARTWCANKAALFMKLLGEKINTQVAVLAGGSRSCNADDLARAALEDQKVGQSDMVAWDSDSIGRVKRFS